MSFHLPSTTSGLAVLKQEGKKRVPQAEPATAGNASRKAEKDLQRTSRPDAVFNEVVFDSTDCTEGKANWRGEDCECSYEEFVPASIPGYSPQYRPSDHRDHTLVFESRFEGGNLQKAVKVYETEYDLILRPDINTRANAQWFYFSISNTRRRKRYKLNIVNLVKPDSLYSCGKKPVIYSAKEHTLEGTGWLHGGEDVCYYANHVPSRDGLDGQYFTLTFTVVPDYDHDTLFIANAVPFPYSALQEYLRALEACPRRSLRFRRRELCQTLEGNRCDLLTITSFTTGVKYGKNRQVIFLSARIHPGETTSSWAIKGAIDFLTSDSIDAHILRENFVFKVVPMLNPDGCIVGNQRCSLGGEDLNRLWDEPSPQWHPTIYHTKMLMKNVALERSVGLFLDIHGHSRRPNAFIFGCGPRRGQSEAEAQVFAKLVENCAPHLFSFLDCNFSVQKDKEATGRVTVWRELNLHNSFTLEISHMGPNYGELKGLHYSIEDLEELGKAICLAVEDYWEPTEMIYTQALHGIEQAHQSLAANSQPDATGESDSEDESCQPLKRSTRKPSEKKKRRGEKA